MPPNMHGRKYHIFLLLLFCIYGNSIIYSFKWLLTNIIIFSPCLNECLIIKQQSSSKYLSTLDWSVALAACKEKGTICLLVWLCMSVWHAMPYISMLIFKWNVCRNISLSLNESKFFLARLFIITIHNLLACFVVFCSNAETQFLLLLLQIAHTMQINTIITIIISKNKMFNEGKTWSFLIPLNCFLSLSHSLFNSEWLSIFIAEHFWHVKANDRWSVLVGAATMFLFKVFLLEFVFTSYNFNRRHCRHCHNIFLHCSPLGLILPNQISKNKYKNQYLKMCSKSIVICTCSEM